MTIFCGLDKIVLFCLSIVGFCSVSLGADAHPPKPNIVFIMADDLGWADVDFHGGNVPTPNLDRLRRSGVELTQHYVAPLCTPTRAGLMTGRYWSRFGVSQPQATLSLPFQTVTLPRALKDCHYETCIAGKWHLGSKPEWGPQHFGFDHSYGSLGGGVGPYNHFYKRGPYEKTWHRNGELVQETGHVTDLIAHEAVQWIADRRDAPFFLYVPFTAVHLPIKEPDEYLQQVPASINGQIARQYAASIIHLDQAIGEIVQAIEQQCKLQQTLIVFTSDNGGSTAENNGQDYPPDDYPEGNLTGNNLPLRGQKGDPYEGGTRVPTLLSWPSVIPAGSVCHTPMHITDWMPTFCFLAGYRSTKDLKWDGSMNWPAVMGQTSAEEFAHREIYSAAPGFRAFVLRSGDWKLILFPSNDRQPERAELYNIRLDPNETRDLTAEREDKLVELKRQLAQARQNDFDSVAAQVASQ